jgi:beta-lactamase class A
VVAQKPQNREQGMGGGDGLGLGRRTLLLGAGLLLARRTQAFPTGKPTDLATLERAEGVRLGLALLDTGTGTARGHRMDERFALCSTFKLPLAGLVLQAADRGEIGLGDAVPITAADIVPHAPVTEPNVGKTLTIRQLARCTQTTSDNAAANLLMRRLGGPYGVTQRLRALGDQVTRIDRFEPEMNRVTSDDQRDTSTPEAMAATVAKLVVGDHLTAAAREELAAWMVETKTGLRRLRAGAPARWRIGDKTGTGHGPDMPNRVNDIAVLWPPHRAPLVVAAFLEAPGGFDGIRPADEAILAKAMRLAIRPFLQA